MANRSKPNVYNRNRSLEFGRSRRRKLSRRDQGEWPAKSRKYDIIEILIATNRHRIATLVPLKFKRMAISPFGFFRGTVDIMAADLSLLPVTGIRTQICGDAHVGNLGSFEAPDGRLIFDINDFDETVHGPWEWDIKRMAASLVLAGRLAGNSNRQCDEAVHSFMTVYRGFMAEFAKMTYLELARFQVRRNLRSAPVDHALQKAQRSTPLHNLEKLTVRRGGKHFFRELKPAQTRVSSTVARSVVASLRKYRETLLPERRLVFDRYSVADVAFKVVGTGSVGTRDYVLLMFGNGMEDPLFMQVKEEPASNYNAFLGKDAECAHHGKRVVEGQRLMQAQSDMLLGWTTIDNRHFLVRQLCDHKASIAPEELTGIGFLDYARVCGEVLAKGHAHGGDPAAIAGYCGQAERLDFAIARFAKDYADQAEADHAHFCKNLRHGLLKEIEQSRT